jgi:pantetheine-phosphate adenylyltransferase
MSQRAAVYPGTFDPVTDGHMDIIKRASKVVDRLVVAVAVNVGKDPLLSLEERTEILGAEVNDLGADISSRITVMPFDNLLVDFVDSVDATIIIRGLRAVSDFEYEFQMASMNGRLNPYIETVFLTASENHQFIASRFVKEIGRLGGDIGQFVSTRVKKRIDEQWNP